MQKLSTFVLKHGQKCQIWYADMFKFKNMKFHKFKNIRKKRVIFKFEKSKPDFWNLWKIKNKILKLNLNVKTGQTNKFNI